MWLTNARYLGPGGSFELADIAVDDGVISEIAAPGAHPTGLDCTRYVLLPGLVNGHYHSQSTLLRGLDAGLEIFDWFGDTPGGRAQQRIGEWLDDPAHVADVRTATRYEYLALLRQGVTFVADSGLSEVIPSVLVEEAAAVGIRSLPQAYDEQIEAVADPSQYTVHIESEEDLTAAFLDRTVRYRDEYEPVFGLHCLETVKRRELVLAHWGASTVSVLRARGLLGPRTVLFHGCEMTADDVEVVARAGAAIMHCPVSNLSLHGRTPPAVAWYQAGITLGLGTDWADTDMWRTMRAAWLLQQQEPDRARRAAPVDVLRMATRGGAVGYSRNDLGEIAPGRCADLVFLDADRLGPTVDRPDLSTLAFAILTDGGPALVRHVLVAGDWALRDGVPTRVDAAALTAEYRQLADTLTAT